MEALCAIDKLNNYVNTELEVVLFSGEGDSLHQLFDCMVQGPYARVDLWSTGSNRELPVPNWARDSDGTGLSRILDLPCMGSKLFRDMKPPFTCGGHTRRAIIKYFVRDHINKNSKGPSIFAYYCVHFCPFWSIFVSIFVIHFVYFCLF
jgi:hypothetical protein